MSYMSRLDQCVNDDMEYFNRRHSFPVYKSSTNILESMKLLGLKQSEVFERFVSFAKNIQGLARTTGYSFSALLHLLSVLIRQCCVLNGEDIDDVWMVFSNITLERDW